MDHQLHKLKLFVENENYCVDVKRDQFNRLVVYTNDMKTAMTALPDYVDNAQVLVHFASSLNSPTKYFNKIEKAQPQEEELSLELLAKELEKLSDICTWDVLTAIFFEVHDKDNAITSYSDVFGSVNSAMTRLYNLYGYDVLSNELRIS